MYDLFIVSPVYHFFWFVFVYFFSLFCFENCITIVGQLLNKNRFCHFVDLIETKFSIFYCKILSVLRQVKLLILCNIMCRPQMENLRVFHNSFAIAMESADKHSKMEVI